MGKRDIDNNILGDIPPASFDTMSADEMRVLLREYQIELEKQKKTANIKRESNDTILSKALIASTELIDENPDGINYQKMTDTVLELSGAQYACFNIFDENGFGFTTIALSGINENIQKVSSFLGFEVINKKWDPDPVRDRLTKDNVINRFKTLHEITGTVIPTPIVTLIVNTFNIGEITLVKIDKNEKRIGDFTLIFAKGDTLQNPEIVELFANQVGMFIDRKRVTNALRANEECNRTILYTAMEGFWIVDLWGNILEVNDTYCQMSGYSIDELLKMRVYDIAITDTPDKTSNRIKSVIEKGALHFESKHRRKDKTIFDAEINLQYRPEEEKIYTFIHDISDRKEAENLLLQTQQNYETFFNTIDDFLFVLDEQGNIIHINNTVTERLGYTFDELFKKSVLMIHPPERREEAGRIVAEMLQGTTEFCPIPIITKSGIQIPVETRVSRGFWDGKPVIFGVTKDISKITLSEEKFSKIFYTNPSASGLSDLINHQYLEVNEAFYTLFGFNKDEVIGKTAYDLKIMTPETRNILLQNADHDGNILNVEVELKAKNGDIKHVIISAEIIIIQDRKYRFTVVNDITDRKRAEEELQLQYRLQQLLVNTSTAYINLPLEKLEITIKSSLHDLAIFVGADRSYIFDYDYQHEICINTHEWCTDGIEPQIDELQAVPFSELQEWMTAHIAGKSICIPDVSTLPSGWGREILEQQNIKSLITVPLMKNEECIGFVGFDSVRKNHNYTDNEQQLLTVFARMLVNIKMRQITENTLRENEQRTRVIFETLSEGIALNEIVYNDNGEMVDYRIIEVNDAFYKITGLPRDAEVIGNVATRLYGMDINTIKYFWINHINQKETVITEVFNPLANKTFSVSTSPFENHRFVTSFQDITELKQLDDIRKESETRLNRAEKVAQVGNWKLNLNTWKIMSSDGARFIYGVAEDELPIDIIKTIPLPEYRELLDNALINLIKNGTPYNIDFKIRRVDDGRIVDIHSIAEYDKESNIVFGVIRDVTQRNRLLETLRNSEEKYRIITENSSDVIWHLDSNYCFDYISPADEKIRGFKLDEVLGTTVWSLLKPEAIEYVKQANARRLADEAKGIRTGTIRYELEMICKDGSWLWTEVNSTAHHDANGKLIGLHGVTRDISERKLAEKALITQQENLKAIFSSAPVGMLLINDEFLIIDSNIAFEQLMMRNSNQIINQRGGGGFGCIHSFEDERGCGFGIACHECQFRHILTQVLETGAIIHGDEIQYAVIINGEDHHLWLSINAEPVMINGSRHAIIAINDTTERKKVEEALKISEENYRTIFNSATEAIFILDAANGKMIDINEATIKLYGYSSKEEILSGDISNLGTNIEPYTDETAQNYIRKTITEGTQTFEWIARKKDGSIFWIEMTLKKTDIDGEGRIIAVGRDITERKHAQELIEKRIVSLTRPLESDIEFDELFNLNEIQRIQDEFALATGVASIITHPDGTPITRPSNFTYLCSEIIRKTERGCANCFKSDAFIGRYHPNGPVVQPCLSGGLFDAGACITVGGRHIANWLIGQVRNESQTEEKMRRYAKEIGADEEELLKAFDRVPGMSLEHFKLIANTLFTLANYLSTGAYQNLQQARFISERKKIEEALRDSEFFFKESQRAASIGSYSTDFTTGYWKSSEVLDQVFGIDESYDRNVPGWLNIVHPDDREMMATYLTEEVLGQRKPFNKEYRITRIADGETRWVHGKGVVTFDENGKVLTLIGTIHDITERKQTEEALRDSEARLSDIIFNTADWVWEVDSKGVYTYSSPQCYDILGITPEEIIGKTPFDFMPIDEATRIAVIFAEIVANKQPIREMENWNIGIDGEKLCLLTDGLPLFDEDGNITGYRGVDKNITERKLAQEALRDSEARYRSILDASPDDITITDMQGRIDMVSSRGIAMFGYKSQDEGVGKLITDFIVPEDRERASANIAIKFKGVNTGPNEYTGIRADGSTFALESNSEFIYNSDGIPTNIVFVIRDITDRKRTEAALIESESKFRNLVWDMHVGVLLQGPQAEILMSNPKALELLGISEDQLLGKTSFDPDWNVIHEDGSLFPGDTHPVPTAIATRTSVNNVVMGVYRPDTGDRAWLLVDAEPVLNDDGTVKQVVCSFIDISELKNAEAAMLVSEERFRAISEYSHSAICIVDENAQILWINEKMMEISGFKRAQIMAAESFISFIAPESADFVVSNFMEFVAGHEYHHHYNFYIIRADGEHRLLEKHMTHYTDKHGRRSLIISMLDVTETERAAKALIESEEKFSTAFKASPEAISIIAMKDGTYIDVNDIFLKISGFEKEDIIGRTALDLDFWVDNNERNEYKDRLLKHGFIRNFEAQYKMRFGEIRNFIVSSEVIELDGEKCSLNFIVDISERKKAEQALRENEAKQGKMVANIGDVIVIIDKNGINQYKSPNIERWFGWTPEDVIGKPALDNVHPDDVDAAGKFITSLMTTPDAIGTTECRYRCKDGSYKWIEFTGFNLMNDPDIQGLLGNYQDISERKHAEEEKAKLEAQLQHALKMESVGRLAGGVAHDFNNMLQAILGNADMAKEMTPSDSPLRESLDEICNAAERSADLTRQLLAFARKQTVAPKVLNLNETVDGMIKMLQRLIGENINLSWLPGDGLWSTKVDPSQIDQILANLCVNARDAINGVGKITIETENCFCDEGYCANHIGFEPGSYVHLTVSDNGCGMDKEMMEHIFEPFFTTKGVGEGTGLGLATVYGAVKQNNGYIITYSEPGQGTSFNIYLPRHIGKSEQLAKDGKDGAITKGKETILICEDEATILKLAKMMLQRIGYNVLAANTPGEAVQLAEDYDGDIQVLMTDVIMPEMNGRDLARRIQQIYPNIKRLFMSGYTADVIAHHGILEEGVHFLQKPFSMKELSARVRETIEE